ncbi:M48 family metallopeptidase [Chitinophagaceae bacterium MMS25-I14]
MKYKTVYFATLLLAAVFFSACYKNPVTGRKSLNLVDEGTMNSLSSQQYGTFITANKPVHGTKDAEMVQRVGSRMSAAVQQYLSRMGQQSLIQNYKWEFNLVNNGEANAWCMPGGKVVVYSGIMPVVQNETALAVVLGHEIAHAIARHGNERMSQQLVVEGGGQMLSAALANEPAQTQNIFNEVYGITGQLGVLLPYSRKHESEADHMGLIFMALAGYDPNEAVGFWQRMAIKSAGSKPPVFLSTHPDDAQRIDQIKQWVPDAMKYYKKR